MNHHKKLISGISYLLSSIFLLSSTATADTFLMKDGTSINASIISETFDTYLLRAEVSKNVYGEKTVSKQDVEKITKADLSLVAFEKLATITPTPDLMEAKDYEMLVAEKLEPFLKKYPKSSKTKDVQEILDTLNSEYIAIKSGSIKLNGNLLSPEQIEANKYDIEATLIYRKFIVYAKKKQYRPALSILERLEANYPETIQCRKAQKIAITILPRFQEKLDKLLANVDTMMMKRELALDGMTESESNRTKRIFEQEDANYQMLLDQTTSNKKKTKWLPINPYFKEPIQNNLKMIQNETTRISADSIKPIVDNGKFYRETHQALEIGNYPLAKENFDLFKKSKPPEKMLNKLESRLEEAKSVAEQMAKQKKIDDALAKKKAEEERRRLTKEKKNASKNEKNNNDKGKGVKEKLEEKHNTLKLIPQ